MPTSKPKKKTNRPVRFVKSSQPGRRAPKRVVAKRAKSREASASPRRSRSISEDTLPRWRDLSSDTGQGAPRSSADGLFEAVSTLRLALMIIAAAAMVTLYVGHVYATSELLTEVDQLRRDNLELHLRHNQVKADFDRVSGPATIASRARILGLVEAIPTGHPINLDLR